MKTFAAMQAIALVGETLAWGPVLGGIGAGIGFVVTGGDVWIVWGLLGFSLGMLYGVLRLRVKMARLRKELYLDPVRPGALGDCRWVPGKNGGGTFWYEYDDNVGAFPDRDKQ